MNKKAKIIIAVVLGIALIAGGSPAVEITNKVEYIV